jgi:hypothetical protein
MTSMGAVAESGSNERVALVPKAVSSLVNSGVSVVVESGAGERALLPDTLYTEAGATIEDAWSADMIVKVAPPLAAEVARLRSGRTLIGFLGPRKPRTRSVHSRRPVCRRRPRPSASVRAPPGTTCVPRWPIRSARRARSGWIWGSTRPVRAGTPANSEMVASLAALLGEASHEPHKTFAVRRIQYLRIRFGRLLHHGATVTECIEAPAPVVGAHPAGC